MTENHSRFSLVPVPINAPAECIITRTTNGPFIDTGVKKGMDGKPMFRGHVYISVDALREMAEVAGLLESPVDLIEAQQAAQRGAYDAGYAAGYAERVDAAAADLVARMREHVAGPGPTHLPAPALSPAGEADGEADGSAGEGAESPRLGGSALVPSDSSDEHAAEPRGADLL